MKVKKIRNKNSQREIRNSNRSNRRFNFFPPSKKKREGGKKNRKYRTFESLRVILHRGTERENELVLCRSWKIHFAGRFSWTALHSFTRIVRKTGLQRDRYCLQRHP